MNGQEETALQKTDTKQLSVGEVKNQIQTIQKVLKDVMKQGVHYDKIKGCGDKLVLLKPGAEKILSTFMIGAEPVIEDLSDGYDFRYRIIVRGFHIATGKTIGYGVGVCSTNEKKYAWRSAICDEEYEATDPDKRQLHWKERGGYDKKACPKCKKGPNIYCDCIIEIKQVRQNPSDIENTVLKMSKKRAIVDLCMTSTACSDIFEQDLDEDHIRDATGYKPGPQPPQQTPQPPTQNQQGNPPDNNGYITCGLCQGISISKLEKRSDKSPHYKCDNCNAVAWVNNGQFTWKEAKF